MEPNFSDYFIVANDHNAAKNGDDMYQELEAGYLVYNDPIEYGNLKVRCNFAGI